MVPQQMKLKPEALPTSQPLCFPTVSLPATALEERDDDFRFRHGPISFEVICAFCQATACFFVTSDMIELIGIYSDELLR